MISWWTLFPASYQSVNQPHPCLVAGGRVCHYIARAMKEQCHTPFGPAHDLSTKSVSHYPMLDLISVVANPSAPFGSFANGH
jgi:hypothetical protein